MSVKRIGFCCKLSELHPTKGVVSIPKYNTSTTTIAWLNRQNRAVAEEKLWDLMKYNIESTKQLVIKVGEFEPELKMVRLSSDLLVAYTHPDYRNFWRQSDVQLYMERELTKVGDIARKQDVRLSFHPGQFTVLASENPNIVQNSIEEFEYHAHLIRMMGFGKKFQDFKCNVHISGKRGPAGIREAYSRLSPEARNCLTLENEENSWGLDDCLSLADIVPTVLDVHHHWIREGEYIESSDDRVKRVIDSWRGIRPTMHYSVSREDYLVDHDKNTRPCHKSLIESGHKKQKLRAHSDGYWNHAVNEWALSFRDDFDIMAECKNKNIASFELHKYSNKLMSE